MEELFSQKGNFQVVRLSEFDARAGTDHLKKLRELILENEPMYPNIEKWFDEKVMEGLKISERIGYIGYLDERPAVSAVVKRGEDAKFCHLKIKKGLQDVHLGEAFFTLMGLEVKRFAKKVHFTLPESLWDKEKEFFKSFGFVDAIKAGHQYRLFEDELRCSTDFENVWSAILEKFPKIARAFLMNGHSLDSKLVMSIRGENARKVVDGKKKVEIRRRFSKKWAGCKVSIYASGRERCLVGEASISKVVVDDPESIWERFHEDIGCTRAEFDNYTQPRGEVYAIVLEDAIPYRKSISLGEVSNLTQKKLQPPQTYYDLSKNRNWAEAVSMGALLHSAISSQVLVL
jgi:predicted transcriptional regulator